MMNEKYFLDYLQEFKEKQALLLVICNNGKFYGFIEKLTDSFLVLRNDLEPSQKTIIDYQSIAEIKSNPAHRIDIQPNAV